MWFFLFLLVMMQRDFFFSMAFKLQTGCSEAATSFEVVSCETNLET